MSAIPPPPPPALGDFNDVEFARTQRTEEKGHLNTLKETYALSRDKASENQEISAIAPSIESDSASSSDAIYPKVDLSGRARAELYPEDDLHIPHRARIVERRAIIPRPTPRPLSTGRDVTHSDDFDHPRATVERRPRREVYVERQRRYRNGWGTDMSQSDDDQEVHRIAIRQNQRSNHKTRQDSRRQEISAVPRPSDNQRIDVMEELEELRRENERLREEYQSNGPFFQSAQPASTYKIFHYIDQTYYLDEPQWVPGDYAPILQKNNPIRNLQYYLDQHPDIAFAIFKDYVPRAPSNLREVETEDGAFKRPVPRKQTLSFITDTMVEAVEEFVERVPEFEKFFPNFHPRREIDAPYLFMYYCAPYIPEILPELDPVSRRLMKQLQQHIEESHGFEYDSAKSLAEKGFVSQTLFKYLIRPGDVLVRCMGAMTQAYLATDWAAESREQQEEFQESHERDHFTRKKGGKYTERARGKVNRSWIVPVWCWKFDGNFSMSREHLFLNMTAESADEILHIDQLDVIPIRYASAGFYETLQKRGRTFWSLRYQKFVNYNNSKDGEIDPVRDIHKSLSRYKSSERHMVDIGTYKEMHPHSTVSKLKLSSSLDNGDMENDKPPLGEALLLFPPVIPGYSLLRKQWSNLHVDQISDVVWNKQAFKDLVVDEETKELVQALVMKQLAVQESTDVIQGKGNGLILLLHGGPGTGKTFTAEGVAEFAEKPLLRVTCGDVGTSAEVVEKRLKASFHLGKTFMVVLLDEADVFLEERDMKDLNRNALVSVFLRELEYHDGILILTSNRVGTFDEAFKSRLQLALHYENLGPSQRRKIWRNLLTRIKTFDNPVMDFDDIIDHLDDLAPVEMNGREIRNAITTARQLAQFKETALSYTHLQHVIRVSGKFSKYLKDLRHGLTEDEYMRDGGLRLTYKGKTNLQKECPF
ncbi:hypothetical protein HYFRA_00004477 [Hymenoscyphus fraxineus]|uniref:AAA+ ATPase domain-containing protein n=1 Tax=Hymenoscyphus fraxineus TaxID=746836 RepID=A0A9N9PSV8_9HELO|nr:hypothetical protein HYFRA_00004477 [Hymenoscyphus fraxineus]